MRIAYLPYGFLFLASVGCREGPTGPDPTLVVVEGSTATHEGVDLLFQRFNLSWYPADDSPHPSDTTSSPHSAVRTAPCLVSLPPSYASTDRAYPVILVSRWRANF